ncbi:MAG: hypothetical protein N2595_01940 [bacterium]|nr:hypothetical protein [bacterium]
MTAFQHLSLAYLPWFFLICISMVGNAAHSATTSGSTVPRWHLPPPTSRVRVVRKTSETIYQAIPSPGYHYDDLLYHVKIGTLNGRHYLHAEVRLAKEPEDLITLPYVRLLATNGVEFCFLPLSNATFWSSAVTLKASRPISSLPQEYWIACGYAYHRDTKYLHAQGGPQETIIEATTGRVVARGSLRNAQANPLQIRQDSDLLHVGDTLHVRLSEDTLRITYELYDEDRGTCVAQGTNLTEFVIAPKLPSSLLLVIAAGRGTSVTWRGFRRLTVLPPLEVTDNPSYLGRLAVNDSVACGLSNDPHFFIDGRIDVTLGEEHVTDRLPGSQLTNVWGGAGRVITYDRGFMVYTLGLHLRRGQPYVLEIQYPEDVPRTMAFVVGNGALAPGLHTGHTLAQPEPRFFTEQVMFPLSHSVEKAQFLVWAGDRDVHDGLRVGIADPGTRNAPFSHKPLVLIITLYDMLTIARPRLPEPFPPPLQRYVWVECQRRTIWDEPTYAPHLNSLFYGLNALAPVVLPWNNRDAEHMGVPVPTLRYVRYVRKVLNDVEYETTQRENPRYHHNFLSEYLTRARAYRLAVFPIIEYGGTDLLLPEAHAVTSNGLLYEPVRLPTTGSEVADSVDVCHPAVLDDARALLTDLFARLDKEQKSVLQSLIIRRRANFLATAYNDATLKRFVREMKLTPPDLSPAALRTWVVTAHHDTYRRWYQSNLLAFVAALQQAYATHAFHADGPALYYHWRQSGMPFEGLYFQTEERWTAYWQRIRHTPVEGFPLPNITPEKLCTAVSRWTDSEEGLYPDLLPVPGVVPIMPVYGTQAATTPAYAELFRGDFRAVKIVPTLSSPARVARPNRSPLAAGTTLYHAREHVMYDAVLAFITYNPRYLAFDQSHPACFPAAEWARRFILNFIALPAVPFEQVPQQGQPEVYVARARLGSRTYLAVANRGLMPVVTRICLPPMHATQLVPLVGRGEALPFLVSEQGLAFHVSLAPLELRSYRLDE